LTVEAFPPAGTVKGRTAGVAFRQNWKPVPVCVINPHDIGASVMCLLDAIAAVSQSRSCGALLFISDDMSAYVINEERTTAQDMLKTRWREFVGLYTHQPRRGLKPDRAGVAEDIGQHLLDLGRVG